MSPDIKTNPFFVGEVTYIHDRKYRPGFYFYNETGSWHGPYRSEMFALHKLLEYMARLENPHPPSRWRKFWWRLQEVVRGRT